MKVVKTADAKNNLSRYLAYVRRGGRVRILDRDTPIADLVPVEATASGDDDASLLALLEARGLIRRGEQGPWPAALLRPGPKAPDGVATLLDERRQGR